MRIWDLPPTLLCRLHLLGEHRELHAIWSILTGQRSGYRHHPEVLRWEGALRALHARHAEQVRELKHRGYAHRSPLDYSLAVGESRPLRRVDSIAAQRRLLRTKGCNCRV